MGKLNFGRFLGWRDINGVMEEERRGGGVFVQHWAIPDIHDRCQAFDEFYNIGF